jgi:hypothetical protein
MHFRNFDYLKVIESADSLLIHTESFDTTARLDLLRMKGISEYSLKQQSDAHDTFLDILELKNTYTMDPIATSPKILEFYNIIRKSYNSNPRIESEADLYSSPTTPTNLNEEPDQKAILTRSLLLPGWGHSHSGNSQKGRWLLAGALITLPASIYFSWDCYTREDKYLSETNPLKMENLYSEYNTSYKLRNGFITAYLAIWFYSQFDLFSINHKSLFIFPQVSKKTGYSFSIKFNF